MSPKSGCTRIKSRQINERTERDPSLPSIYYSSEHKITMAAAARIYLILLLTLGGGGIVLWSSQAQAQHDRHSSALSEDYPLNSSLEDIVDFQHYSEITPQHRFLLRNNIIDDERTQYEAILIPILTPLNQVWFGLNSKLSDGVKKGAINVCIFLIGWFIFMGTIGCGMRCYLCCDTMRSTNYTIRSLYNSFMETEECYQSEREGIALDTIQDTVDGVNDSDDYA